MYSDVIYLEVFVLLSIVSSVLTRMPLASWGGFGKGEKLGYDTPRAKSSKG